MPNQQLIDYIKKSRELGHSDEAIKALLINAGHKEEDVSAAFIAADGKSSSQNENLMPPPHPLIASPIAGTILQNAWSLYKSRFWTFISLSLVPILIWIAFGVILLVNVSLTPLSSPLITIVISLLLAILAIIISVKSIAALMFAVAAPQPIGFWEAFRISKGKVISLAFWVTFLMSLVTMGGFVMLIVPGFIFLAWFSLSQFVFVVEGHKGLNALLRSKEYVSGNWGKVFLRLIGVIAISIVIYLLIDVVIGPSSKLAAEIVSQLFSLLLTPLWFAYIFSIYQSLRAQKPELVSQPVSKKGRGFFIFSAILGLLAIPAVMIMTTLWALDPKGILEDSRDAQRLNDLNTLNSAISLYQAVTDGTLSCIPGKVYSSRDGTRAIDGTGWLPIDLAKMEYGSPIAELFIDPNNNSSYFYSYACDPVSNKYELNTRFEGETYKRDTKGDGGNNPDVYEVGTDLNLIK